MSCQIVLRDVHEADLQHLVGFGVVDEVMQPAPRAFELLKIRVVQDQIDLLGQLAIDLGDDRLDRLDDILADKLGLRRAPARRACVRLVRPPPSPRRSSA